MFNVGDKIVRILSPDETWHAAMFNGEVVKIEKDIIICTVYVDLPRTMQFYKKNGVSINDNDSFIVKVDDIVLMVNNSN